MIAARPHRLATRLLLAAALAATGPLVAPAAATAGDDVSIAGADKIAPDLAAALADGQAHDFGVELDAHADNSAARQVDDWSARGTQVAANLRTVADRSQGGLRALLDGHGVRYDTFWIANVVYVDGGDLELAREIAGRAEVGQLIQPLEYGIEEPIPGVVQLKVGAVEWGIADINADDVWAQYGTTGQGIVVANIDTGVDYTHPALVEHYRGNIGAGEFDHSYNWYDPTGRQDEPTDGDIHGTHTMGSIRRIDEDVARETGDSATVGIENADGSVGLQYSRDEPGALSNGTAIRFLPPA